MFKLSFYKIKNHLIQNVKNALAFSGLILKLNN